MRIIGFAMIFGIKANEMYPDKEDSSCCNSCYHDWGAGKDEAPKKTQSKQTPVNDLVGAGPFIGGFIINAIQDNGKEEGK